MSILVLALALQLQVRPYVHSDLNALEAQSLGVCFVTICFGSMISSDNTGNAAATTLTVLIMTSNLLFVTNVFRMVGRYSASDAKAITEISLSFNTIARTAARRFTSFGSSASSAGEVALVTLPPPASLHNAAMPTKPEQPAAKTSGGHGGQGLSTMAPAMQLAAPPPRLVSETLPGWAQHATEGGTKYYYNTAMGVTSWKLPEKIDESDGLEVDVLAAPADNSLAPTRSVKLP